MERGYLVAALALTMTFAGLSRGFRSLEQISFLHFRHSGVAARAHCPAADLAAKLKARVRPRTAEEVQVLAESVPIAVQSGIAEQMSRQEAAISRCARERALREAERATRELMRSQRIMQRYQYQYMQPMAVQVSLPVDLRERIQERTARAAARIAAGNAAMQVAAVRMRFAQQELPVVHLGHRQISCPHRAEAPEPPAPPDAEEDSN